MRWTFKLICQIAQRQSFRVELLNFCPHLMIFNLWEIQIFVFFYPSLEWLCNETIKRIGQTS